MQILNYLHQGTQSSNNSWALGVISLTAMMTRRTHFRKLRVSVLRTYLAKGVYTSTRGEFDSPAPVDCYVVYVPCNYSIYFILHHWIPVCQVD